MPSNRQKKAKPARPSLHTDNHESARPPADIPSPATLPAGTGIILDTDPRMNQVSETEEALERATEPSETAETEEADQRRKSDEADSSGA